MGKYIVETSRLILRPFTITDAKAYFSITRDENIKRFVPYACPETFVDCLHDFKKVYTQGDFRYDYYIAIEEKSSHKLIGSIICVYIDCFDISAFVDKKYRGQGYMKEALASFLSSMPKGSVIRFDIQKTNQASLRIISQVEGSKEQILKDSQTADFRRFVVVC